MGSYAIMRCKKLSSMGSVASSLKHAYRERETPNADSSRTPDNEHRAASTTDEAMGKLRSCCLRSGAKMWCLRSSTS